MGHPVILDGLTWLGGEPGQARPVPRSRQPSRKSSPSEDDGVVLLIGSRRRRFRDYLPRGIARYLPPAPPVPRRTRTRENP